MSSTTSEKRLRNAEYGKRKFKHFWEPRLRKTTIGVTFSKGAHMWLYYKNKNNKGETDVNEFFMTKAEAEKRMLGK